MLEKRLIDELLRVSVRLRRTWMCIMAAALLLTAAAVFFAGSAVGISPGPTAVVFAVVVLAAVGIAAMALAAFGLPRVINLTDMARRIESRYPDLNAKLLSAVEQRLEPGQPRLGYLQTSVVGEALAHGRRDGWVRAAPARQLFAAYGLFCASLVLLVAAYIGFMRQSQQNSPAPLVAGATLPAGPMYDAAIEPGDIELERGTSLLVLARFAGELPPEVVLSCQGAGGQRAAPAEPGSRAEPAAHRLAMSKSLDDPLFAGRVPNVQQDLSYHVEFGSQRSPAYHVTVFDYPELHRADVKLAFPAYTGQADALVEDTHQVTAVEGTRLTFIARLNKAVAQARLVSEDQQTLELAADPQEQHAYTATFTLARTGRFKLHLVDAEGRTNRAPAEFTFTAVMNRRPEIKLVFPSKDVQVSPLEEIELAASVWDDFGLLAYGIAYSLDGQPPREVRLGEKSPAKDQQDARRLVSFEELRAEPDQLLSYFFWADDAGPDGLPRRTSSDMFFCEVRHFEEIFRQGEQPPGSSSQQQQQGASQQADKLADLQKQVISATWKLVRRESEAPRQGEGPAGPSAEFAKDAAAVLEGQHEALALADQLEARLQAPESKAHLDTARRHMRAAVEDLQQAAAGPAAAPLTPALASERAAYQALLKLRAREHQVVRGNNRSRSASSAGQRSAEQLSELELKETDNRYEEQRTAADPQEDAAQREDRQVLNRLRELAQRQQDLNQRIKEVQSALDEAKTEQEKEELRRQLKRLRDEEQQILRDADELRNRMEQPANQQRMAEARKQLDQTRQNVRQASEALEKGQASQAAAAGTRAQRQLEDLREQFRKQAAGRFNEVMRQMREDARQLEQNQKSLAERLADLDAPKAKSLRESSGREEARQELQQQQADLEKLLRQMRTTVEEAETSEPLLSKQLYDTIRQAHQQKPVDALEMTRQLLERGFLEESRQAEQKAQAGITRLREGVERAAESVLGDEAEALRRARDQVAELGKQIKEEMERSAPAQREGASTTPAEAQQPPDKRDGDTPATPTPQAQPGQPGSDAPAAPPGQRPQPSERAGTRRNADPRNLIDAIAGGGFTGPLTGGDFRPWSDRLRDVEEMLDEPQLRAEAARIRDRASAMRAEFKRHSKEPDWELVRTTVYEPLLELRERLSEELLRRQAKDALVPLDRDPVPPKYTDQVRRYYERLGSGQ